MSDFPTMDADRSHADTEYGRDIIEEFNPVEAYVVEMDSWVSMPLRLAYNQAAGLHIEFGPYDLGHADIRVLRQVIAAYDLAVAPWATSGDNIDTKRLHWTVLDSWATYPAWHSEAIGERYTYRVAPRNWNEGSDSFPCELLITEGGKYVISLSCLDLSIAMKAANSYEFVNNSGGA